MKTIELSCFLMVFAMVVFVYDLVLCLCRLSILQALQRRRAQSKEELAQSFCFLLFFIWNMVRPAYRTESRVASWVARGTGTVPVPVLCASIT